MKVFTKLAVGATSNTFNKHYNQIYSQRKKTNVDLIFCYTNMLFIPVKYFP